MSSISQATTRKDPDPGGSWSHVIDSGSCFSSKFSRSPLISQRKQSPEMDQERFRASIHCDLVGRARPCRVSYLDELVRAYCERAHRIDRKEFGRLDWPV